MSLQNLNLYVAWLCVGYLVGVTATTCSVYSNLMWSLPGRDSLGESPVCLLVVAVPPAWVWHIRGLVPRVVLPGRESRQRRGERLVAIPTTLFLFGCAGPPILHRLLLNDELTPYVLLAVPVGAICVVLWAVGLYAVYSSAQRSAKDATPESAGRHHE